MMFIGRFVVILTVMALWFGMEQQLHKKVEFMKDLQEEMREAEKARAAGLEPPPSTFPLSLSLS